MDTPSTLFFSNCVQGDILLTRNHPSIDINNLTPGFLNHAAFFDGYNVIEAQDGIGVIESEIEEFYRRYPIIIVMRYKGGLPSTGFQLAKQYLGRPYWRSASLFRFLRDNDSDNCVSLVRRIYKDILGTDLRWKFPDNIYSDTSMKEICKKHEIYMGGH